jgi:hypothetical protein
MSEPFEQKARQYKEDNRALRAVLKEQKRVISEFIERDQHYRNRLIATEEFLMGLGYRRVNLEGEWTLEPLEVPE